MMSPDISLLQGLQGRTDGIEHVQQEQTNILIHVQDSVARTVMLAAGVVQALQHP